MKDEWEESRRGIKGFRAGFALSGMQRNVRQDCCDGSLERISPQKIPLDFIPTSMV
ncbi:MAG TPA: hypothetical protein VM223_20270 [Planctomycetota bacterium]|nr:hypothetical protein [Planctomycetota bacterium]